MQRIHSVGSLALLVLMVLPLAAHAQIGQPLETTASDPSGHWAGAIQLPGNELEVDVDLRREEDAWTGDVSIPAQGAADLPLTGISVDGRAVRFSIQGVPGSPTFAGRISAGGDTLSGEFTQAGGTFPFTLTRAVTAAGGATASLDGLDAWMRSALEDFDVPGAAVGVLVEGEVVLAKGYGYRDVARELPVDAHTLFAIGSATKAFTTFGLARMADLGEFDWDRPIREYLPEVRFSDPVATQLITPRDMVTHRTGLPRHDLLWYGWEEFTPEVLIDALPHLELDSQPRAKWQYNNLMFVLAGHLLGQLRGETWESAMRELVLDPLGMDETNFDVEVMADDPNHALPYATRGDTLARIPFRDISPVGPAGSINSNIDDMLRWARVHVERGQVDGDTLLSLAALRDLHTPQMAIGAFPTEPDVGPMSYALGWFVEPFRGHYRVHHGGNIDGFSSLVTLFPFDRVAVVVLTNRNASGLPSLATSYIADRVLGLEPQDRATAAAETFQQAMTMQQEAARRMAAERVEGTSPDHELSDYAAVYQHPGYGDLVIRRDGNRLVADYHGLTAPLEHWHYEVFSGMENPDDPTLHGVKFQFENDLTGHVSAVRVPLDPTVDAVRFERKPDPRLLDPAYLARFEGRYVHDPLTLRFTVRGSRLVMHIPGQQPYELVPDRGTTFRLPEMTGYWVEFEVGREGQVEAAVLHQPNGVFRAERVTEQ